MATHDYVIANGTGAAVRSDLNDALAAIVSNNSGSSEPATTYAYQWWADTTNNLLKLRNSANNAWITLRELDGTLLMEDGSNSAPGLSFASDTNTGFFSGGADKIGFATGGVERLEIGSSEVVFNDPSNDVDFRVESNGNTHMLFVDAGNDRIGVGTNSPAVLLDVADSSGNEPKLRMSTATATNFFQISRSSSTGHYTLASEENGSSIILATDPDGNGAVDRLTVDRNGNVGIGGTATNASDHKSLALFGNANTGAGFIEFNDTSGNADAAIFADNGSLFINADYDNTTADSTIRFRVDGSSEKARIDSSGRLLVGTSSASGSTNTQAIIAGNTNSAPGVLLIASTSTTPSSGDNLGVLRFSDAGHIHAGYITCDRDGGTWTSGSSHPSRLTFYTSANGSSSPTERMKIHEHGRISMAHDGSYYNSGLSLSVSASSNADTHVGRNTNASFSNSMLFYYSSRSQSDLFSLLKLASNNASDTEFNLRGDGNAFADASWNGGGADYAEYFEWSDGNTEAEDRRGISVVLDGDKIREAVAGEEPIGVISGNPSVVGDSDIDRWKGKYLRDDFGTYLQDTHNVVEWDETITDENGSQRIEKRSYEDWNIPAGIVVPDDAVISATDENGQPYTHRRLNPDYNPETAYISREDRPEWDTVGLMGKLRIRKGQVTGTRWIKMRDVSDTVEEWLVR